MGKGYFVFENPSSLAINPPPGTRVNKSIYKKKGLGDFIQIIPPNIIRYVNNYQYIVACQEVETSKNILQDGVLGINGECTRRYWIINKKNDSIFGPLDVEQYKRLRKRKKIDITLEE